MYVQKSLHLFDFLHLYSYVHLLPYLYDFVQRYYFSKMLHSCFLQMFYFQPKYVISHLHKKISVRQMYVILYNYVYTVKHNDGDDVPSSHHPNNRVPNNSDPNPKTGPSSRHRNHPNPSRNRRTDRSPNSGPGCKSRDHTNRRTSHHTIRCTTDHSNRPSHCRCSH